jgi:hypothetical protein
MWIVARQLPQLRQCGPVAALRIDLSAIGATADITKIDEDSVAVDVAGDGVEIPGPNIAALAVGEVHRAAIATEGASVRQSDALDHAVAGQVRVEAVEGADILSLAGGPPARSDRYSQ